jgi:hypothetical protein
MEVTTMNNTYNVTFAMDLMSLTTTVTIDSDKYSDGYDNEDVIDEANFQVWEAYQFSPLMQQRQGIEVEEVWA